MHILEAVDLYRFYHADEEETLALRGVSLHVAAGEIVVVMVPLVAENPPCYPA